MKTAQPWLETPINFAKIKKYAKIIVEHNKGHFSGSDNAKELPSALNELMRIAKS